MSAVATCPKCNGTTRRLADQHQWKKMMAGYRESDDSMPCDNCGGQTMSLTATGVTRIDPATGLGCMHEYHGANAGRCYTVYTCAKCRDQYGIDSSD